MENPATLYFSTYTILYWKEALRAVVGVFTNHAYGHNTHRIMYKIIYLGNGKSGHPLF